MTLKLQLSQDLEQRLSREAACAGLPIDEYALRLLGAEEPLAEMSTGRELLEFWKSEGVVGSRPEIRDSQAHARRIRHRAEQRTRT